MVSALHFFLHLYPSAAELRHHREMNEISIEGVTNGTAPANVLFGINMHKSFKLPLIWMKKHLE